jgi:hypothetical protein
VFYTLCFVSASSLPAAFSVLTIARIMSVPPTMRLVDLGDGCCDATTQANFESLPQPSRVAYPARIHPMTQPSAILQIETDTVVQGLEIAPLEVFPESFQMPPPAQRAPTPDARLSAALGLDGDAAPRVEVCTRGLAKALAAAAITAPDFLLLSSGDADRAVLHLMCTFRTTDGEVNDDSAMHIWMLSRATDD